MSTLKIYHLASLLIALAVNSASFADEAIHKNNQPDATKEAPTKTIDFQSLEANTSEMVLPNGLKVIVRENHRSPVVVFQIWYKVGSSDEAVHISGLSHVLEHMMFKGTPRFKPGELSKFINERGGEENAFTSRDHTAYYQFWQKTNLATSFEIEADRMQNLTFNKAEFTKELEVVKEERRQRTEDQPSAKLYERFNATAFVSSPYRIPTVGWMHDLNQLTLQDSIEWYQKWYAPNNAFIVITGDTTAEEAFALAKTHFGQIPAKPLPKRQLATEIEPLGERRITVKAPAKLPVLYMGFNAPSLQTTKDPKTAYALYMLANVLDGGYSSRLQKHLVRDQQVAASAGAGYSPITRGDTLFMITGTPHTRYTVTELENAFWAEIRRLQNTPPSTAELERVKSQMIAGLIYQQDSLSSQAMQIGRLESAGVGWKAFPKLIEGITQVTPQEMSEAAKQYLIKDRVTIGILQPQSLEKAQTDSNQASNKKPSSEKASEQP